MGLDPSGRGLSSAVPELVEQDLAAAEAEQAMDQVKLPGNLRIEQFVPKRKEYSGVKSGHRALVSYILLPRPGHLLRADLLSADSQLQRLRREA